MLGIKYLSCYNSCMTNTEGFLEQNRPPESAEATPFYDYVFYYVNDEDVNTISEPLAARNDAEAREKFKHLTGRDYGETGDGFLRT